MRSAKSPTGTSKLKFRRCVNWITTCHYCVCMRFVCFIFVSCVCARVLHHVHSQIVEKLMAVDSLADMIIAQSYMAFP